MSKTVFNYVLSILQLEDGGASRIRPELRLAATLELLASGSYQHIIGNDYLIGMAQSTVSTMLWETLDVMEQKLCSTWIKFAPRDETKEYFFNRFKIPGVIGLIDGTHIPLIRPVENEHMFFNRKGYHSLNSMIVSRI